MADQIERVKVGDLSVAKVLHDFVNDEVLPGIGMSPQAFWRAAMLLFKSSRRKTARFLPNAIRCRPRSMSGIVRMPILILPTIKSFLTRSVIWCPRAMTLKSRRPMSTMKSPKSPARSWWCRSTTRVLPSTPLMRAGAAFMARFTARMLHRAAFDERRALQLGARC